MVCTVVCVRVLEVCNNFSGLDEVTSKLLKVSYTNILYSYGLNTVHSCFPSVGKNAARRELAGADAVDEAMVAAVAAAAAAVALP